MPDKRTKNAFRIVHGVDLDLSSVSAYIYCGLSAVWVRITSRAYMYMYYALNAVWAE